MPTGAGTIYIKSFNVFRAPFGNSMNMNFLIKLESRSAGILEAADSHVLGGLLFYF
jgi:hypothetical protein